MIKKIVITIFILNLLFLTAGCSGNLSNNAAIIDGQDITIEEFSFAANVCKSETILYFSNKYNVSDVSSDDFWNGTFGENKEKPIDVLKENALDFLKYSHTIFSLAKEQGIVADCSFETIKKMYNEENEHRKGDDIVYGVTGFDFSSYYDWLLSNCELELENIEEDSISQSEIENYYKANKEKIALKISIVASIIRVILLYILIPIFGFIGIEISMLVSVLFIILINSFFIRKHLFLNI